MSLGLNDLKKVARKRKASTAGAHAAPKAPIKPWSNRGLAKAGAARNSDYHVNEDWIEIDRHNFLWRHLNFERNHEDAKRTLASLETTVMTAIGKIKNLIHFLAA